ncbi:fluoride efflux transporter CrcB [Cytobacillus sp. S13-E01]|uniref:fluoride efflux transporter CrcB n=1 Tax=Cytobacillus sp. S13-E01 TaxID=3031326 RepID=UPI0023D7C84A|nr:fluoride efflux transporter CrcB [Cytobacillus sp. S13-E01]MDF0726842.1 fluoride efflux transporter CrcB [Cytobacillus sp. S13-E01]
MNFKIVTLLLIGGFFGSITRFSLGEWLITENGFPAGTLFVNIAGCLFLGWFLPFANGSFKRKSTLVPLIGTGFTGSFTTFSTFSVETLFMLAENHYLFAITNIALNVGLGLVASLIGFKLALKQISEKGEDV